MDETNYEQQLQATTLLLVNGRIFYSALPPTRSGVLFRTAPIAALTPNFFGTKWPLYADVPLSNHSFIHFFYSEILLNLEGRKEGIGFYVAFNSLGHIDRDEIETRNREEIPYSSRIVPRGLSVAEGP